MSTERVRVLSKLLKTPEVTSMFADEFIDLLIERDKVGQGTYGESLHTHNGRDAWQDAIEEVADLLMYTVQCAIEDLDSPNKRRLHGLYETVLESIAHTVHALYEVRNLR